MAEFQSARRSIFLFLVEAIRIQVVCKGKGAIAEDRDVILRVAPTQVNLEHACTRYEGRLLMVG